MRRHDLTEKVNMMLENLTFAPFRADIEKVEYSAPPAPAPQLTLCLTKACKNTYGAQEGTNNER